MISEIDKVRLEIFREKKRIGGIMVIVRVSSVVYCEYELCSGQSKHYKISTCYFSIKYEAIRSKSKNWLPQIMFPNGTTWLRLDCSSSELALDKSN